MKRRLSLGSSKVHVGACQGREVALRETRLGPRQSRGRDGRGRPLRPCCQQGKQSPRNMKLINNGVEPWSKPALIRVLMVSTLVRSSSRVPLREDGLPLETPFTMMAKRATRN